MQASGGSGLCADLPIAPESDAARNKTQRAAPHNPGRELKWCPPPGVLNSLRYAREPAQDHLSYGNAERQDAPAHRAVSLPLAITGPVGCPVGEPPGGSSETASVVSGVIWPTRSGGITSLIGWPGCTKPSERGRPPG